MFDARRTNARANGSMPSWQAATAMERNPTSRDRLISTAPEKISRLLEQSGARRWPRNDGADHAAGPRRHRRAALFVERSIGTCSVRGMAPLRDRLDGTVPASMRWSRMDDLPSLSANWLNTAYACIAQLAHDPCPAVCAAIRPNRSRGRPLRSPGCAFRKSGWPSGLECAPAQDDQVGIVWTSSGCRR
jgi:hypothetical protein